MRLKICETSRTASLNSKFTSSYAKKVELNHVEFLISFSIPIFDSQRILFKA